MNFNECLKEIDEIHMCWMCVLDVFVVSMSMVVWGLWFGWSL